MPSKRRMATGAVALSSPSDSGLFSPTVATNSSGLISAIRSRSIESSLSLPLLEGLFRRPGAADSILRDAFDQWKASRRIVRNIEFLWKKRKHGRKNSRHGKDKKASTGPPASKRRRKEYKAKARDREKEHSQTVMSLSTPKHRNVKGMHWLFQSLASAYIRERTISFQILAMGCPLDHVSIRTTIELLVLLIEQGNPLKDSDAACMVAWLSLLKVLLVDVLSGPERLAYCVRPDIGLPWLCQILWKVGVALSRTHHEGAVNTTRVCLALVDVIHSLVLKGRDHDTTHQIHKFLWSEKKTPDSDANASLSSLACLMGTYHLWKESHYGINRRIEEKYKTMMEQLIDPSILPKIDPPESDSSDTKPKAAQRLSDFLLKRVAKDENSGSNDSTGDNSAASAETKKTSGKPRSSTLRTGDPSAIAESRESEKTTNASSLPSASQRGDSTESTAILGSPSGVVSTDRSMVASVARLFSSLYNNNDDDTNEENIGGASQQPIDETDEVDVYNDDDDANEDEQMTDDEDNEDSHFQEEEDHDDDDDDDEVIQLEEGKIVDDRENEATKESVGGTDDEEGEAIENENPKENDESSNVSGDNSMEEDNDINSEDDEEIDSDEGEDCVDCNSMMEDDDDHQDEIVIHEDEIPRIEQGLLELQRDFNSGSTDQNLSNKDNKSTTDGSYPTAPIGEGTKERSRLYIKAAMEVLAMQHPPLSKLKGSTSQPSIRRPATPLTLVAEEALMSSIMKIVKPEKKPLNGKIVLRRAPTQEEFFRGNLSTNPISFNMLECPSNGEHKEEPTVRDLRQHIANDLQMGDSAELLELLLANKILDVDLKLRVILQTVWKDHLIQNAGRSSSSNPLTSLIMRDERGGARTFLSSSSGLSLMLFERSMGSSGNGITADTPAEALPPMIMTYRLIGVDGEATEDTVSKVVDPEAPVEASSPEEMELLMEKEFGITRTIMSGRGVVCLLRSVQSNILHTLKKIRRDGVGKAENHARNSFNQSFYPGLSLLVCCAKLPSNRKLLLQARAPTILLQLLLAVLDALQGDGSDSTSESNSTATALQELISLLASDILLSDGDASSDNADESDVDEDASTLRLLIQAIETSSLSKTLRNVIAKLVPYLTYGKPKLSQELALEFMVHVDANKIEKHELQADNEQRNKSILTDTFIHAAISLPANDVCNSLRVELIKCGFVEQTARLILRDAPADPPFWSPSLWSNGEKPSEKKKSLLEKQWKTYANRSGLKTCFEILIGLCKEHESTQAFLGKFTAGDVVFFQFCHWLESTSDNVPAGISMKAIGLLAETLLDDIVEFGKPTSEEVRAIKLLRRKSRERKKEIAMERRKKSLMTMNHFGSLSNSIKLPSSVHPAATDNARTATSAPFWAPVLGLFRDSSVNNTQNEREEVSAPASKKRKKSPESGDENIASTLTKTIPDWMKELESIEDETGLKCAVCQEGRKYKSKEMMGLYAYVKKVSIQNGDQASLEGRNLLMNLPQKLPSSLKANVELKSWHSSGVALGAELTKSPRGKKSNVYTTTVCAGNAIHMSCHAKARQADRNHPKAPKSEWEGAALRNSRVSCNVIYPLVSSKSSSVSLVSVEQALTEHQTIVGNLIGAQPKSNLWSVLHDVRLLLLRMAYGEALNADCGGGSLGSNAQLIYHQLSMAKMFESEAQIDDPSTAKHARDLSTGFLAASSIIAASDCNAAVKTKLTRDIAYSSLMAAITSILFHNVKSDGDSGENTEQIPHPDRRWLKRKEIFLRGLLKCAGCRHALAIHDSGCISPRSAAKRTRSRSFVEWDLENDGENENEKSSSPTTSLASGRKSMSPKIDNSKASIDDFGSALRPMIVFYAMMDQLSSNFAPNYDDEKIDECANQFVEVVESCHKSKSIHHLLEKANVTLSHEELMKELQRGMMSA